MSQAKDVESKLVYIKEDGRRPYSYIYKHEPQHGGGELVEETVMIKDARKLNMTLEKNGIALTQQQTAFEEKDFYNSDYVKKEYYAEMCELAKRVTGGAHAIGFGHIIRHANHWDQGQRDFRIGDHVGPYAFGVHTDYTAEKVNNAFLDLLPNDPRCLKGKWQALNLWRNIREEPIDENPLAVLDCTSVAAPDDFVMADIHYLTYTAQQYALSNRRVKDHRWVYYPSMGKSDVLIFKQYDSNTEAPARMTFHSAFKVPNQPEVSTRASIECRVAVFFPDFEPNTIFATPLTNAQKAVRGVLFQLKGAHTLPTALRLWFRWTVHRPDGIAKAAAAILDKLTEENHFGFGTAGPEERQEFLRLMVEGGDFAKEAKHQFEPLLYGLPSVL